MLLCGVGVLNTQENKVQCIVFLKDCFLSKINFVSIVGKENLLEYFPFLNAYVILINRKNLEKLANFDFVEYVSSIQKASILLNNSRKFLKIDELHKKGITGKGVTIAVIDTGCYMHLDFCLGHNRIKKFCDFVGDLHASYDDNGHGTFVCGVACGNGLCKNGLYRGVAPDADLVVLKALNSHGETNGSTILKAMQWVLDNKEEFNIKVVCMSFGSTPIEHNDPLMEGAKVLWENGICVVCAAGNDGPTKNSIKSPGACPNVITVGSVDKLDLEQDKLKVAPFSSRGPAFDYVKPDILAPGVEIVSTTNGIGFYSSMSGTSVSTPFIAGICALMLQNDTSLSPNQIKEKLMEKAQKIDETQNASGSGFVNLENIFN